MNQLTTSTSDKALSLVIKAIRQDPGLAGSTKDKYIKALENYSKQGLSLLDTNQLRDYCLTASGSTKAFLKAGVRRLALEIEYHWQSRVTFSAEMRMQSEFTAWIMSADWL